MFQDDKSLGLRPAFSLEQAQSRPAVRRILVVTVLWVLALSVSWQIPGVSGQTQTGILKGHVVGGNGEPGASTQIQVEQLDFADPSSPKVFEKRIYTDQNGNFAIELPAGVYDLFVSRVETVPVARKIRIRPSSETIINLKLKVSHLADFLE